MSSALQLTAIASIINGQGLAQNSALSSAIGAFHALPSVNYTTNVYNFAANSIDTGDANLGAILGNLGLGVNNNTQWMLDFYPPNVTPTCSTSIGYVFQSNIDLTYANISNIASFSYTLNNQSQAAFAYGLSGFANVFNVTYGYAYSALDIVGSIYILKDKTYSQSGIGYSSINDLATAGIGTSGNLIAQTVSNWGTMYDATKLNLIGDPYVFGQNLLNQGLGNYGNLSAKLTAAGLDVSDITAIPQTTTVTKQTAGTLTVNSMVGAVDLPITNNVTTTNVVTANSPDVVIGIYKTITGNDLAEIVAATQTTILPNSQIITLADYLNFNKIIPANLQANYLNLGISNLNQFGNYVYSIIGRSNLVTWTDIATLLSSIQSPTFSVQVTANSSAPILSSATINTLQNYAGTGSGPLTNPIMSDFLGTTAGIPYTGLVNNLVNLYKTITPSNVETTLVNLGNTVKTYASASALGKLGLTSTLQSEVLAVNSALNALGNTTAVLQAANVYYSILNGIPTEISNLSKAGATIGPAPNSILFNFAQNIGSLFSDTTKTQSYEVIANLITNDQYGDTIRAAIAEYNNISTLRQYGIVSHNDPAPSQAIDNAHAQNIPLSTYLSQNK